ncbi:hypothetical protein PpBr36_03304 [Pyricularia pennisetigena]|uniref:hypothetical protein n=1 Tax=Pyricularia pennisetigena TaxID=1578925 RepID=UPI00114EB77A|nr:hypothetical protein PpBr36_03304 [Pyricularia pennisetigena]TLS30792.1 hypothetical protein PpBr36_03304 [Pyricularia pennisetigena]
MGPDGHRCTQAVARRTPPCDFRASASQGSRTLHKERCDMIRMEEKKSLLVMYFILFFSHPVQQITRRLPVLPMRDRR